MSRSSKKNAFVGWTSGKGHSSWKKQVNRAYRRSSKVDLKTYHEEESSYKGRRPYERCDIYDSPRDGALRYVGMYKYPVLARSLFSSNLLSKEERLQSQREFYDKIMRK